MFKRLTKKAVALPTPKSKWVPPTEFSRAFEAAKAFMDQFKVPAEIIKTKDKYAIKTTAYLGSELPSEFQGIPVVTLAKQ